MPRYIVNIIGARMFIEEDDAVRTLIQNAYMIKGEVTVWDTKSAEFIFFKFANKKTPHIIKEGMLCVAQ